MRSARLFLFSIVCLWVFSGCQSPQVSLETIGSTDNASWQGNKSYDVLVVAYAYEGANRIAFEDQMAQALRRAGVNAQASHLQYPAMSSISTQSLNAYMKSAENGAILFAHALSITRQDYSEEPTPPGQSIFGADHTNWEVQVGAIIEAALYVEEVQPAVWLNRTRFQSETAKPSNGMKQYVNELMSKLREADVISRLK